MLLERKNTKKLVCFNEKWVCKMETIVLCEMAVAEEQETEAKHSSEEKGSRLAMDAIHQCRQCGEFLDCP